MAIIVQKYGGSSLGDAEKIKFVAERIVERSRESSDRIVAVCSAMADTTDDLIAMANIISHRPDQREMDVLLSTGETKACALLAMALLEMGYPAISLTGMQAGIHTEASYGRARISNVQPDRIKQELERGKLVIVAGFQGVTDTFDVTTLGRGSSDLTAVALAAALSVEKCEIYTDVDGIYTADPRVVTEARKLDEIEYAEMLELASMGAKMQPRSIELAAIYNVPVFVTSTFSHSSGTKIHGEVAMETRNRVRGVAHDLNVAKITVRRIPDRPGIAAALFEPLGNEGISVDTIVQNTGEDGMADISFTVAGTDLLNAIDAIRSVADLMGTSEIVHDASLGKVSIVGTGIQNAPGYASKMFSALAEANINIDMITTSEIRITCIVAEHLVEQAVRTLHQAFDLHND
ncbi:aspartate kinase [SAR202 cluster bacterium AD-802-E10_MRT_200m]|nr:aspartate kinase [SAR202 cluster bacterium AD-802-E10_MRT_200m]